MKLYSITRRSYLRLSVFMLAIMLVCVDLHAQGRNAMLREPVAVDCDTALTSDLRIVRRPYRLGDNLFWGINVTGFYTLISEVSNFKSFDMLRPGGEFVLGKYFTPWISASLDLSYNWQREFLPLFDDQAYSFHTAALALEGQLCLNRFFTRYSPKEKFVCYGIVGGGMQSAFAFDGLNQDLPASVVDAKMHFSPYYRTGVMLEWRASESVSLTARSLWSATAKPLCGLPSGHNHQGMEFSIGLVCRMPNHYAARTFQNCRGNEIYYFRYLEDQLLEDHQHQLKRHRKGKAEMPDMSAEQDSILIFPCGYPYLTVRQEAKLDLVATRLSINPHLVLIVDLYPIAVDDPKMTSTQSMQRAEDAIRSYLLHSEHKVNRNQMRFRLHDEPSPVPNQSIWIHGAFLSFVQ